MTNLGVLLLYCVLQYSTTSSFVIHSRNWDDYDLPIDYFDYYDYYVYETTPSTWNGCPEGESFFTKNDLESIIHYVAKIKLKIQDNLVDGYHKIALDVKSKHLKELDTFQNLIEDKPKHIKHILEQIKNDRSNLKPIVMQTIIETKDVNIYEEQIATIRNRLQKLVAMMGAYETIYNIHTGNQQLTRSFGPRDTRKDILSSGTCGTIKDIFSTISDQLTRFQHTYMKEVLSLIEDKNHEYDVSISTYRDEIKKRALRQHKTVMYDILKLQDDYIHLKSDLEKQNITAILNDIKDHLEKNDQLVDKLQEDVLAFGKHCLKYGKITDERDPKVLLRRNINIDSSNHNIVQQLLQNKIKEIKDKIKKNLTDIFEELDERLNNPNIIDWYSDKLVPKEEDLDNIKHAQEGLLELKEILEQSSLDKIQELWKKAQEVLSETEKIKKDLDIKVDRILPENSQEIETIEEVIETEPIKEVIEIETIEEPIKDEVKDVKDLEEVQDKHEGEEEVLQMS